MTPSGPEALARRLRALREEWPKVRITQAMLAQALEASPPLVSAWEKASAVPRPARLRAYATIFSTRRSVQDGRVQVLPDEQLTICNGIFSAGVYGAVRCLTDAQLRDRNEAYLADHLAGSREFGLLIRVSVLRGNVVTPDLTLPETRLYEWSS